MVRLQVLTPEALKSGRFQIQEPPPKLEDALAVTVVNAINDHLRNAREVEKEAAHRAHQKMPELQPHYAYAYTPGIVSDTVLHVVIQALRDAGWKHSKLLQGSIVIAREPYDVGPGRGQMRLPHFAAAH